jgi:hypothetical protein
MYVLKEGKAIVCQGFEKMTKAKGERVPPDLVEFNVVSKMRVFHRGLVPDWLQEPRLALHAVPTVGGGLQQRGVATIIAMQPVGYLAGCRRPLYIETRIEEEPPPEFIRPHAARRGIDVRGSTGRVHRGVSGSGVHSGGRLRHRRCEPPL